MTTHICRVIVVVAATLAVATGCITPLSAESPIVMKDLKLVSAGHTGCLPDENEISNVTTNIVSRGTWNATCKGKTYLCTAVPTFGDNVSFSCAPVAQ